MAALVYSVDFSGWYGPLALAQRRVQSLGPALDQVGKFMVGVTRRNLENEGGPRPFVPLAEATLINRARYPRGPGTKAAPILYAHRRTHTGERAVRKDAARRMLGAKPLIWTRKLFRNLRHVVGDSYVDTGSTLLQSWRLFFGSRAPTRWGHGPLVSTPARYPFSRTPEDDGVIKALFVRHILGPLGIA